MDKNEQTKNPLEDQANKDYYKNIENGSVQQTQAFEITQSSQESGDNKLDYKVITNRSQKSGSNTKQETDKKITRKSVEKQKNQQRKIVNQHFHREQQSDSQQKKQKEKFIEKKFTSQRQTQIQNTNQQYLQKKETLKEKTRYVVQTMLQIRQMLKLTFPKKPSTIHDYQAGQQKQEIRQNIRKSAQLSQSRSQQLAHKYDSLIEEVSNIKIQLLEKQQDLQRQRNMLQEKGAKKERQISQQINDLQLKRKFFEALQSQNEQKKQQLAQLKNRINLLQQQLRKIKVQLEKVKKDSYNLQKQISQQQQKSTQKLNQQLGQIDYLNRHHTEQLQNKNSQLKVKIQKQKQLEKQLEQKQKKITCQKIEYQRNFTTFKQLMQQKMQNFRLNIQQLQKDLESRNSQIEQNIRDLKQKQISLESLQIINEIKQKQLIQIKQQKKQITQKCQLISKNIEQKQSQIEQKTSELSQKQISLEHLQTKNQTQQKQLIYIKQQNKQNIKKFQLISKQLIRAKEESTQIEIQKQQKKQRLSEKQQIISDLHIDYTAKLVKKQQQINGSMKQRQYLEKQLEQKQNQLNRLNIDYTANLQKKQQQINGSMKQRQYLEKQLEQKQNQLNRLNIDYTANLQKKQQQINGSMKQRQYLEKQLKQKLNQLNQEIKTNQKNLIQFKKQISEKISSQSQKNLKQLQLKQIYITEIKQKNQELQKMLKQRQIQSSKLKTQLENHQANANTYIKQSILQEQKFQTERTLMKSNINEMKTLNEKYLELIKCKQQEIQTCRTKSKSILQLDRNSYIQKIDQINNVNKKQREQLISFFNNNKTQAISQKDQEIQKILYQLKKVKEEYVQIYKKLQAMRYSCAKIIQSYECHYQQQKTSSNHRGEIIIAQTQSILKQIFNVHRDKLIILKEKQEKQNTIIDLNEERQNLIHQIFLKSQSIDNLQIRISQSSQSNEKYLNQIQRLKKDKSSIYDFNKDLMERLNNQAKSLLNQRSSNVSKYFEEMIANMNESHKMDIDCREKRILQLQQQLSLTLEINNLKEEDLLQSLKEKDDLINQVQNLSGQQCQKQERMIKSLEYQLAIKTKLAEQLNQQRTSALQKKQQMQTQKSHQTDIIFQLYCNIKQKSFSQLLEKLVGLDSAECELVEMVKMFHYKQRDLLDKYEEAKQSISELNDEKKKLIKEKDQLILIAEKKKELEEMNVNIKKQLTASTASQKQQQILQNEIDNLKLKIKFSEEVKKSKSESNKQAQFQQRIKQLQQMYEAQNQKLVKDLQGLKDKNKILQSKSSDYSRYQQEKQNQIEDLTVQLSSAVQNVNKFQLENQQLKQNSNYLMQQIKQLKQNVARLQLKNQRPTEQQESSTSNLSVLKNEVNNLKAENNELKQLLKKKQDTLSGVKQQAVFSLTQLQNLKKKKDQLSSQIKILQGKNRTSEEENQRLQRQLKQRMAQTAQVSSRPQTSSIKIESDSSQKYKKQIYTLNDKIKSQKREVDQLKNKLQDANQEVEYLKATQNSVDELIKNLNTEKQYLTDVYQKSENKVKELQRQINEYSNSSRIKVGTSSLRVNNSSIKIETNSAKSAELQIFNSKQVNSNKLFGVNCIIQNIPEGKENLINKIQQYSQAKIKETKLLFRLDENVKTFANVFASSDSKKWSLAFVFRRNKNVFTIIALQSKIKGAPVCMLISLVTGKTVYQSKGTTVPALKFDTSNLVIGNRELMIRYESKIIYIASPGVKYFEPYAKQDIFGQDSIKSQKIEPQEFEIHRIEFA